MINANWNGTGIWIENTSAYFKINNCSIISAGLITNLTISDILINNSMNGIISNCQVNLVNTMAFRFGIPKTYRSIIIAVGIIHRWESKSIIRRIVI